MFHTFPCNGKSRPSCCVCVNRIRYFEQTRLHMHGFTYKDDNWCSYFLPAPISWSSTILETKMLQISCWKRYLGAWFASKGLWIPFYNTVSRRLSPPPNQRDKLTEPRGHSAETHKDPVLSSILHQYTTVTQSGEHRLTIWPPTVAQG